MYLGRQLISCGCAKTTNFDFRVFCFIYFCLTGLFFQRLFQVKPRFPKASKRMFEDCKAGHFTRLPVAQRTASKHSAVLWLRAKTFGNEKSARRCKHCALAVVRQNQKFRPAADPLPGGVGRPKFNQLEMVTTFTYKPSSVRIDAHNFELSW